VKTTFFKKNPASTSFVAFYEWRGVKYLLFGCVFLCFM